MKFFGFDFELDILENNEYNILYQEVSVEKAERKLSFNNDDIIFWN